MFTVKAPCCCAIPHFNVVKYTKEPSSTKKGICEEDDDHHRLIHAVFTYRNRYE